MKMVVVAMLLVKLVMTVARRHMIMTMTQGGRKRKLDRASPITVERPDSYVDKNSNSCSH